MSPPHAPRSRPPGALDLYRAHAMSEVYTPGTLVTALVAAHDDDDARELLTAYARERNLDWGEGDTSAFALWRIRQVVVDGQLEALLGVTSSLRGVIEASCVDSADCSVVTPMRAGSLTTTDRFGTVRLVEPTRSLQHGALQVVAA